MHKTISTPYLDHIGSFGAHFTPVACARVVFVAALAVVELTELFANGAGPAPGEGFFGSVCSLEWESTAFPLVPIR